MEQVNMLTRCLPEDVGIPSGAVERFIEKIEKAGIELHSFMLLRHGRVAAEGYWAPYAPGYSHMLYSLSKSFTSTAVGFAIEEGLFKLDDYLLDYFADEAPRKPDENLRRMRVRDLLCMATGHEEEPAMFRDKNWEKGFLAAPVPHKPGTYFLYNTPATYMLSSLVTRRSGQGLVDYLMPRLFEPLGIERPIWDESPSGVAAGGFGLHLKTEDIARFGQMLLQEGVWQGKQIVPKNWLRLATAWQIDNSRDRQGDWALGYGFQFWRCRHNAYRGDGMFGQFCVVMPDQDAVFAATAGTNDMQGVLDALFDEVLPAISRHHLPADPQGAAALARRIAGLRLPERAAEPGQIDPRLLDRSFSFNVPLLKNPIGLRLSQKGGRIHAELRSELSFAIRLNRVRLSKLQFGLNERLTSVPRIGGEPQPVSARGFVRENGGLLLTIQFLETPYRLEAELRTNGDAIQARVALHPQAASVETGEWTDASMEG